MTAIKILLVDDETDYLRTLEKRLQKRGFVVCAVTSGEEALKQLATFPADVVLLDVKLRGMDGLTTLHKIKRTWSHVEVIMLTGHANQEVAIHGLELGAFEYLMKPVDFEELLYKLEDACVRKTFQINEHGLKKFEKTNGNTQ
ncbi:response regulator [Pseudodesulfovibrio piezophilus]|uniref:Response regulator receiver protein n=1 Tax=Pseudodesulfovibrio piezophilus (strain DSM 21447 / JCM 15486 / C1TLV30) TaxID=1322246 RepID=M1WJI0_PSEP2|nr:response regulator [Pseudodesulfovibrio piezophilus]CCH47931.1 Response regulator receiver protein [Pseudodesulfovibrio piezophilus C1TLV30]